MPLLDTHLLCCLQVCWACEHTLASASDRDNVIRMYNFETEDNYMLHVRGPVACVCCCPWLVAFGGFVCTYLGLCLCGR